MNNLLQDVKKTQKCWDTAIGTIRERVAKRKERQQMLKNKIRGKS